MIMHDWHVWWSCGVGKFVMSPPVLKGSAFDAFSAMADCIKPLLAANVKRSEFSGPEHLMLRKTAEAIYKFEKAFPATEHCIMLHLVYEIAVAVEHLGPTFSYWMYPFERFVGQLSRSLHDRGHPERDFINHYCVTRGLDIMRQRGLVVSRAGRRDRHRVANDARAAGGWGTSNEGVGVEYKKKPHAYDVRGLRASEVLEAIRSIPGAGNLTLGQIADTLVDATSVQVHLEAHLRSSDSRRLSFRSTTTRDKRRTGANRRVTCTLYSLYNPPGVGSRKYVVRHRLFIRLVVGGKVFDLTHVDRFPVETDEHGLIWISRRQGEKTVVSSMHIGGLVGLGNNKDDTDALYVFPAEDTLYHEY
jgi:hypothetical protein